MESSEYMDLINEIEDKFPVDQWKVNNIHIWPIIRCYMGLELDDSAVKTNFWDYFINILKGTVHGILTSIFDYRHNYNQHKQVDFVFLVKSNSRFKIKRSWYEKFSDSFIDNFNISEDRCKVLEYTPVVVPGIFRYRSSQNIQLHYTFIKVKSLFQSKKINLESKLEGFSNFLMYLTGKKIRSAISILNTLEYRIVLIQNLADYFKKILRKVKPKMGFVICYYETTGYAFVLACKELGIPCVDMQHGVQGDLHVAYGRWNRIPKDGYELLPSYFWCWSNYEVEQINKWSYKVHTRHKPIVGGNLWLKKWQQDGDDVVNYYDQILLNAKNRIENSLLILYTLQPGLEIPDWLLKAMKNSPPSWYWWLRLHPGMISKKGYYKKLIKKMNIVNVEIELATRLPLLAILRHSNIHITVSSSTIIEALSFNVPSIIISPIGAELYSNQIDDGTASVAYNEEDLFQEIINKASTVLRKNKIVEQNGLNELLKEIYSFNNY